MDVFCVVMWVWVVLVCGRGWYRYINVGGNVGKGCYDESHCHIVVIRINSIKILC